MRGSSPNQVGIIPQGQIVTNASSNISPHHGDVVVLGELSNISQNKSLAKQEASKRQRIDTSVITTGVLVSSSDSQENDRRKLGRI